MSCLESLPLVWADGSGVRAPCSNSSSADGSGELAEAASADSGGRSAASSSRLQSPVGAGSCRAPSSADGYISPPRELVPGPADGRAPPPRELAPGCLVEVLGLEKRPELNHQVARVLAGCPGSGRCEVGFSSGLVAKVKEENLACFGTADEEGDRLGYGAALGSGDSIPWHGRDGLQQPWLPEMLSLRWVRETLRRATSSPLPSSSKAAARIISMANATERRAFMSRCVEELTTLGVDCRFFDAVDGRALGLAESQLRGDIHGVLVDGAAFTVDTSAWPRNGWTADMMAGVRRRFEAMRFYPHYWTAVDQNIRDPQTLGFVGGHISHASVWREAHELDLDWVLVLEDDALPAPTLGLSWADIWRITAYEIDRLRQRGEDWDLLYVGRTLSMTPEGRRVSGILCEPGYCLRTHSYCLSRRGCRRLLESGAAATVLHCPQDEVLATLCVDDHVHAQTCEKVVALRPRDGWRALAVRWRGLTAQLIDVERTARAESQAAAHHHG